MKGPKVLPYRQALPYLLKQKGWSYRDLDHRTRKSASYWNQTVTGRQVAPQNPEVYERLADIFDVSPDFFAEYNQLKAADLVLRDPSLAYKVRKRTAAATVPVAAFPGAENLKSPRARKRVPAVVGADFAVLVRGDSLRLAGVLDDDVVYLRRAARARDGNLVLARAGGLVTLRFYERDGGRIRLSAGGAANPELVANNVEILGVTVALMRAVPGAK